MAPSMFPIESEIIIKNQTIKKPQKVSRSYPDEELRDDHVALATGQVQRVASVSLSARLVDLLSAAVGEQQNDGTEVLLGRCPQQLLAQGKVDARQRRQKQTLLVLRPDPALPLLPDRQNGEMETLLEHGRLSLSSEEVHEHR